MPRDARQCRETFARFGLAMYHAQCVEKQVAILTTLFDPTFAPSPADERDARFDRILRKTLGRLVSELRNHVSIPANLEARLDQALRYRNWLAHGCFWDRASGLLSPTGRETMIQELHDVSSFLDRLDDELTAIGDQVLGILGVTQEQVEAELQKRIGPQTRDK